MTAARVIPGPDTASAENSARPEIAPTPKAQPNALALRIGDVQLPTNLFLAPVAGWFDLAYRLTVRSVAGVPCRPADRGTPRDIGDGTYGAVGLTCTELLCPHSLLREADRAMWRAATSPEDQPICMQLYGCDPDILIAAAHWAVEHGATVIDINMGCPVDKVTKKHGGSKLLCDPAATTQLAKAVVDAVDIPVTAKIRLGWDDDRIITDTLPPRLCDVGIAAITVHGRTTAQRFKPSVRLGGIADTVTAVKRSHPAIPVIGNGDIASAADAAAMIAATGCDGVMVARGAMGQPWLFREIAHRLATGTDAPPLSQRARAMLVLRHAEHLRRLRDERQALHGIRQRIAKYSPHLQPWPELRRTVHAMRHTEAFFAYWHARLPELAA